MEDAITAIIMAFSVLVFIIALSLCMYMVDLVTATSSQILYSSDKSNYLENIAITSEEITTRNVDFDTIVPTLYRYYKENFCVKFFDARGGTPKLIQVFDLKLEGEVRSAVSKEPSARNNKERALVKAYGTSPNDTPYMFQAPWIGNINKHCKTRIDLFVSGQEGDINNVHVNYTNRTSNIDNLKEMKQAYDGNDAVCIEESFVEYNFSGETIESEDGTETITGSKKPESKIIIIYTLKNVAPAAPVTP